MAVPKVPSPLPNSTPTLPRPPAAPTLLFATTRSTLPSPLTSVIAIESGKNPPVW